MKNKVERVSDDVDLYDDSSFLCLFFSLWSPSSSLLTCCASRTLGPVCVRGAGVGNEVAGKENEGERFFSLSLSLFARASSACRCHQIFHSFSFSLSPSVLLCLPNSVSFPHLVHRSLRRSRTRRRRSWCCLLLLPRRARSSGSGRRRRTCSSSTLARRLFLFPRGGALFLLGGGTALLSLAAHPQATLESAAAIRGGEGEVLE